MIISLIAAVSDDNVIGINNTIPWRLPEDMKYFKTTTLNKTVIMGRKTFESMNNKPLPNRINIVVSKTLKQSIENVNVVDSLDSAYELASVFNRRKEDEIFIIGGHNLYKESLIRADKLYITKVHTTFNSDFKDKVYFPEFDKSQFVVKYNSELKNFNRLTYEFRILERTPTYSNY